MQLSTAKPSTPVPGPAEQRAAVGEQPRLTREILSGDREKSRFTIDGSNRLENFLGEICHEVEREIQALIPPSRLQAVLLAGG